jgi:ABC-type multidrug transport system ATPase subunit
MLEVKNLTKKFGNIVALDNLNFTAEKRKNFWYYR